MKHAYLVLSWFFSIIFILIILSMAANGHWLRALVILIIVLLLLPSVRKLADKLTGKSISWLTRFVSIIVLLAVFFLVGSIKKPKSIYKSPKYEAQFMALYDAKMK